MKITIDTCKKMIQSGFSLIPIIEKKKPLIQWKQYQEKAMSESEIENWHSHPSVVGIGMVCGYRGLEVVDIDTKILPTEEEKKIFWNEYKSLLKDNIEDFENKFVIVKTVSGGYHIIYRTGDCAVNTIIAKPKGYKDPLIETRGTGGYAVMYNQFIQGKSYLDVKIVSETDREILWECSKIYNYVEEDKKKYEPIKKKNKTPIGGITPWEDFNNKNSCWDLISSEFNIVKKTSKGLIIRRNGATSASSGTIFSDNDLLYLFSTATQYPHQEALSAFTIYAIQKHNGDYSAAAKELYRDGYGSRRKKEVIQKKIVSESNEQIKDITFPLDIFPENIQAYILDVNNTLNASIDYLGSAFLWVMSLCLGNAVKVQIKTGWHEPGVVWISIVGRAGIGKSHNISAIVRPLKKINEREIELYNRQLQKYKEYQSLDAKEKKKAEEVQEPKKNQFIVGDITMEAFVDYHAANPNGIGILRDELSAWIKDLNKYRDGSDLENYLSCWSGDMLNLTRKTSRSGYVQSAYVPIIGGVQPSVLSEIFTPENKDNGFNDRWLICYPDLEIEKYNDKEMRQEVIEWYDEFVIGLYEEVRNKMIKYDDAGYIIPFYLKFNPDAYKEWHRIFDKITDMQNSEDENEYMKSILPKQKRYIPRFALLLNVLNNYANEESYKPISKKSILDAERLSDYFIMMAKKNKYDSMESREIKEVIKSSGKRGPYEKFISVYEENPNFNRSKLADELNVSRVTINNYINKYNEKV